MIVAVIFPALLLFEGVSGATTPAPLCYGGLLPCGQGAQCDSITDECVCPSGFQGEPRVACAADGDCVCTTNKDPVFGLFDPKASGDRNTFKVNLPCSVEMVQRITVTSSCVVGSVVANPTTRKEGNRVFVESLTVTMIRPAVTFTIDGNGVTIDSGDGSIVSESTSNGFQVASLTGVCDGVEFGVNSTYGGSFIITPAPLVPATGFCGNCDGTAEDTGTTFVEQLSYVTDFVADDQTNSPYPTQCDSISLALESFCGDDASREVAVGVCSAYLTDFGVCLEGSNTGSAATITNYDDVMDAFTTCLENVCLTDSASECSKLSTFESDSGCTIPAEADNCAA